MVCEVVGKDGGRHVVLLFKLELEATDEKIDNFELAPNDFVSFASGAIWASVLLVRVSLSKDSLVGMRLVAPDANLSLSEGEEFSLNKSTDSVLLINPNPAAKDDACTVVFGLALVLEVLGNSSVDIVGFDDILLGLVLAICIVD